MLRDVELNLALRRFDIAWRLAAEAPWVRIPGQGHTWGLPLPGTLTGTLPPALETLPQS